MIMTLKKCNNCDGTGYVRYKLVLLPDGVCSECNGKGTIDDDIIEDDTELRALFGKWIFDETLNGNGEISVGDVMAPNELDFAFSNYKAGWQACEAVKNGVPITEEELVHPAVSEAIPSVSWEQLRGLLIMLLAGFGSRENGRGFEDAARVLDSVSEADMPLSSLRNGTL